MTFSLLIVISRYCMPSKTKVIPIRRDISMWISFCVSLHFKSYKAHIVSIHLWIILMISIKVNRHRESFTTYQTFLNFCRNLNMFIKKKLKYYTRPKQISLDLSGDFRIACKYYAMLLIWRTVLTLVIWENVLFRLR